MQSFSKNYVPSQMSKKDQRTQARLLTKSRNQYRKKAYFTRKPLRSFHSKPSRHVDVARRMYN
jgi:hypothetical protein